jgi:hypothetical protein
MTGAGALLVCPFGGAVHARSRAADLADWTHVVPDVVSQGIRFPIVVQVPLMLERWLGHIHARHGIRVCQSEGAAWSR